MNVAVLTCTRDRLAYTTHCFDRLRELAGCEYDHYIYDNGSTDGTPEWLRGYEFAHTVILSPGNVGISRAMNRLLDEAEAWGDYDVIVKVDNDCELTVPGTLARITKIITDEWILSPRVLGLLQPPAVDSETVLGSERVGKLGQVGGIFLAATAKLYERFRYSEGNPTWGMDDAEVCQWHRDRGGKVGYLMDVTVNHYRTTAVQNEENPAYFARKKLEMGIA